MDSDSAGSRYVDSDAKSLAKLLPQSGSRPMAASVARDVVAASAWSKYGASEGRARAN